MLRRRRVYVRRIRPSDPGYGTAASVEFPWMCLPYRNASFGRCFRTQELAFRFGERLAVGDVVVVGCR